MRKFKKNGFTLIELLITIGIVGLMVSISVISVNTIIKNSKENGDRIAINNIKKVAGVYVEEYKRDITWDENNKTCIPIQSFVAKGYLKKEILENDDGPLSIVLTKDEYNQIIDEELKDIDCDAYARFVKIPSTTEICNDFIYTGNAVAIISKTYNNNKIEYLDTNYSNLNNIHPKNAGEYKVAITLNSAKQWEDNTIEPKIFTCNIDKRVPNLQLSSLGNIINQLGTTSITLTSDVDGVISVKSSNKNYVTAKVVGDSNIKANVKKAIEITTISSRKGATTVTITVEPTGGYEQNYKKHSVIYTVSNIENKLIEKPTSNLCNNVTYTGKQQTLVSSNDSYLLLDNYGVEIGNYVVTARLKYGYLWNDNTTDDVSFNCEIKAIKPTITYKDAVCDPQSFVVIHNKVYGLEQELCNPTKKGYTFLGWYTDNNYLNKVTDSTLVTNDKDHDLYAKWSQNNYTVTFDANGGNVTTANKIVTYGSKYGDLPDVGDVTRPGYKFDGWFTSVSDGVLVTSDTIVNETSNHTLYAHWTVLFTSQTFEYTGDVQEFTVPITGTYKLEVWGAQGASKPKNKRYGGKGGYSYGQINLTVNDIIYVVVGGQNGYNGGGIVKVNNYGVNGGGATHIATTNGLLSSLSSNKDAVLIVAGGGGGALYGFDTSEGDGGDGGGETGGNGTWGTYCGAGNGICTYVGFGGSQTAAGNTAHFSYDSCIKGGFGYGGGGNGNYNAGGGGGWYGGGSSYYYGGAGGGSGYIGGVSNASMESGIQSGDGKAIITLID